MFLNACSNEGRAAVPFDEKELGSLRAFGSSVIVLFSVCFCLVWEATRLNLDDIIILRNPLPYDYHGEELRLALPNGGLRPLV